MTWTLGFEMITWKRLPRNRDEVPDLSPSVVDVCLDNEADWPVERKSAMKLTLQAKYTKDGFNRQLTKKPGTM